MSPEEVEVRRGGIADVESLWPLWASMVDHHRMVAGDDWPVRSAQAAWGIRRNQYGGWLTDGSAMLLLATTSAGPAGYAMLRIEPSGATWDLGPFVGELESLAVAPEARGAGIGHRLIDECRALLRASQVDYWSVSVVESNEDAVRALPPGRLPAVLPAFARSRATGVMTPTNDDGAVTDDVALPESRLSVDGLHRLVCTAQTASQQAPPLVHQTLEPVEIELVGLDADRIAGRPGLRARSEAPCGVARR